LDNARNKNARAAENTPHIEQKPRKFTGTYIDIENVDFYWKINEKREPAKHAELMG
jgi:hypothetical protein